jgi:hypothetical protein
MTSLPIQNVTNFEPLKYRLHQTMNAAKHNQETVKTPMVTEGIL